jgi:YD repeat-containing protein
MRISSISRRIRRCAALTVALTALLGGTAWAMTYEYDALGRLTKITYDNGSYVEYYYDTAGNRNTVVATKP